MFKKIITYLFVFFLFSFYFNSYAKWDILDNNIKIQSWLEKIKDWLWYTCVKEDCKINLDTIWYTDKDYNCVWDFWWWIFRTKNTDKKCNPWYISYKKWKYEIKLTILDKKTSENILNQKLIIFNWYINKKEKTDIKNLKQNTYSQEISLEDSDIEKNEIKEDNLIKKEEVTKQDKNNNWGKQVDVKNQITKSKTKEIKTEIIVQSWLDYNKWNIWKCKKEDCKINLIASWVIDKNYNCVWNFWWWIFKTKDTDKKCNPWYVAYETWNYNINLKVFSKNNDILYNTWIIIQNISKKIENKVVWENIQKNIWVNNNNVQTNNNIKEKINNLPIAKIRLQWRLASYKKVIWNKIICNWVSKCSINFTWEDSIDDDKKSLKYIWNFWNNQSFIWANPRSIYFQTWKYKVELKVIDNKNQESKAYFYIEVIGKKRESLVPVISINKNIFKNIKISWVLPNNKWKDTREFIELINNWNSKINLKWVILKDNSKQFIIKDDLFVYPNRKKRFYKRITKLSLWNKKDWVFLYYNDKLLDNLSWDFSIPDDFMLTHENIDLPFEKVKVLRVVDWDTIQILFTNNRKIKVRFLWIDTPETKDPRKTVQFYWKQASEFTKKSLEWKYVYLEYSKQNLSWKYNRLLAYVYLDKNKQNNFNKILVEKWYARVYIKYPFKYEKEFLKSQIKAKKQKLWIWQDRNIKKEVLKIQKEEKVNKIKNIKANIDINYENIYNDLWFIPDYKNKQKEIYLPKKDINNTLIVKNINNLSKSIKYKVIKNKKSLKIIWFSDKYKDLIINFQNKNYNVKVVKGNKFILKLDKVLPGTYKIYFYWLNKEKEKIFIRESRKVILDKNYIDTMNSYDKKIITKKTKINISSKNIIKKDKNIFTKNNILKNIDSFQKSKDKYISLFDIKWFILDILIWLLFMLFTFLVLFKKNILQNN